MCEDFWGIIANIRGEVLPGQGKRSQLEARPGGMKTHRGFFHERARSSFLSCRACIICMHKANMI